MVKKMNNEFVLLKYLMNTIKVNSKSVKMNLY